MKNNIRQTALDRKMDRIRALEESGRLSTRLTSRTARKLLSNKLAVLGAALFLVICILCFAAPLFTRWQPGAISLRERMVQPSGEHLFGTDQMGRDVWARILYGGRISIVVGLGSALGAAVIGVTLGMFVGYKGGWADRLVLKISDVFLSFPQMVLIIIMVALVGQSLRNMILIFILTGWPSMYRMARSKVLSLKEAEFVQALNAFGISSVKIAFKHLLPNTVGPIVVNITLSTAMFILQEASLSVLGYGVPQENGKVFVELKKKFDGVVYKRRITTGIQNVEPFLSGELPGENFGQIGREIGYFQSFYQTVPKVFIGYDRLAFAGIDDPQLRITFDTNLRWRDTGVDLRLGDHGAPIALPCGDVLMEVKIPGTCPLWLSHRLSHVVFQIRRLLP